MFSLRRNIWNVRNQIDFAMRSRIKWGRRVFSPRPIDEEFQKEMAFFFELFDWSKMLRSRNTAGFIVADIGARNFSLAPVLLQFFLKRNIAAEIHGIEMDPFRRFKSFHTRHDYAKFFESQTPRSKFHAINFLTFQREIDVAFLLNPFVTVEPHLHWGLPLNTYKPDQVFSHLKNLMHKRNGILIMSNPTEEEFKAGSKLAKEQGFHLLEKHFWKPSELSALTESRIGSAWFFKN